MNIALTYGLSTNCPRKYFLTDRSPNRTWAFSEFRNFWTPIYTSSKYGAGLKSRCQWIAIGVSERMRALQKYLIQLPFYLKCSHMNDRRRVTGPFFFHYQTECMLTMPKCTMVSNSFARLRTSRKGIFRCSSQPAAWRHTVELQDLPYPAFRDGQPFLMI